MTYRIVTDTSSNLPEDLIERFNLEMLPLTFMIEGKEYHSYSKEEHTDLKMFYDMMRDGKVITTSLPNLADSEATFESILAAGEDVLYLGFSSGLSGTYEAMETLAASLSERYPDRTFVCVDTLAASLGQGMLVYYACLMKEEGKSLEEVAQWVRDNRLKLVHWFTVDDLMYLFRGGRVSRTSAWAANLLNIKPVLHVDDEGHLIPMEKTRGRKKSIQAMVDHMAETADAPVDAQVVAISHGDCMKDVEYLKKLVTERFGVKEYIINYVDPVIGAHSGPGTLALFYLGSKR